MAVEIWPPIAPDALKSALEASQVRLLLHFYATPLFEVNTMATEIETSWVLIDHPFVSKQTREIDWLIEELHETLTNLKHGLEDCYALLAPIDPGSTLVVSTPRNEIVKGTVTRVGTRIVKGTVHLRMRTLPHQTLTINPDHPIHIAPLVTLHTLLTHSIDLLAFTLSYIYPSSHPPPPSPSPNPSPTASAAHFLSAQLRVLAQSLTDASSLLKGPPLTQADPTWTTRSVAQSHFLPPNVPHNNTHHHHQQTSSPSSPPAVPPLSFHLAIQDSSLVLWLRSLEPADAPVNFGTKLALAIGTTRRLEHDEAEKMFGFCCAPPEEDQQQQSQQQTGGPNNRGGGSGLARHTSFPTGGGLPHVSGTGTQVSVFVREKVRVETADPSLLSLSSKLTALGSTLGVARRNLAAVMGEELED
ncbi:RAVE subunit 2/Rogdi [Echria macrotheca]|uniref:RAVE subunit 2/Rogdi n=1 Tax=Echria macrotheca TaxID=438768 RepID=A0AAJ0F7K0_9PEZI|nr:RAVE subunit 2/Rogdi [Echria macrotheca]